MKNQIIILLSFISLSVSGQVRGTILDKDNSPISFVQVLNLSNQYHTHSDDDGLFILSNASVNDTLLFSLLGFANRQIVITEKNEVFKITLSEMAFSMDEIVISPRIDALNIFTAIDTKVNPVNSSQEVLRQIPGLFIGQHAGGGKAEQIFLRGFDVDHGTDVSITTDGIPVNMVSHAHGQGYADLHFIIPETIKNINFGKGPYYAEEGNFNTAGYVNFESKDYLDQSKIQFELGQFNTYRLLGMYDLINDKNNKAYIAAEYLVSDGQFESPQNFNRVNIFGKFSKKISPTDKISFSVSHFASQWDASGQIPQRLVDDGTISRFGAVDDTEGGNTSRSNVQFRHNKALSDKSFITNNIYYSKYNFKLFSNFTFFLNDPINGDQIRQQEERHLFGFKSTYNQTFEFGNFNGFLKAGIGLRNDKSRDNGLAQTVNRRTVLNFNQLGDINESNLSSFVDLNLNFGNLSINPALRYDYFNFEYVDFLSPTYVNLTDQKTIISPKLNFLYNATDDFQLYLKTGKGFHSNDTRVVVVEQNGKTLPSAYGADIGSIWKPFNRLLINAAYWYLFLEQEFVYVGDAGIVEQGGRTERQGVDVSIRYQPTNWWFWNIDATYTNPKSIDEAEGDDFIPLAPNLTLTGGFDILHESGLYGGIKVRHLADRPANEDNSIVAKGYTVADFNIGYDWRQLSFGVQIQNLFDTSWEEAQFATESRLFDESESVEEIHFTPGTPFNLKASIAYNF